MARGPRRRFSTPFVVTLAASSAACVVQPASAPPPRQPTTQQPVQAQPVQPEGGDGTVVVANPPRPQPPGPSTPAPADRDMYWNVWKDGPECRAVEKVNCPEPAPGQPAMTCNPPPPVAYACPAGWDGSTALVVTQYQGSADCIIEAQAPPCAPNEKCRKPASQKVPCPTR